MEFIFLLCVLESVVGDWKLKAKKAEDYDINEDAELPQKRDSTLSSLIPNPRGERRRSFRASLSEKFA